MAVAKRRNQHNPEGDPLPARLPLPVMHAVESSVLDAVGFDAAHNVLFVTLRDSGETHLYFEVPPHVFTRLLAPPSKGGYFEQAVRGRYPSEKLA